MCTFVCVRARAFVQRMHVREEEEVEKQQKKAERGKGMSFFLVGGGKLWRNAEISARRNLEIRDVGLDSRNYKFRKLM